jgi:uncharacterized membrane protein YphA (DoxX/SURF4 family)
MKRETTVYWIVTVLFALLMLASAIPDVLRVPQAIDMVEKHLGYPPYFLAYLGVAKVLGAITVLLPGVPRLKEWAFAGLTFDLISAIYSAIAVGDPPAMWAPILVALALLAAAYVLHHRRLARPSPA